MRKYAGLEPRGALYGGWESDTIAGHMLGHYLSALVLSRDHSIDRGLGDRDRLQHDPD